MHRRLTHKSRGYSISPGAGAKVWVQFGIDTNSALKTWTQPSQQDGGAVSIFVAGMKANSTYHMQSVVQFPDGAQFLGPDQIFDTGATQWVCCADPPTFAAVTTPGMEPQSGVELLDMLGNNNINTVVTDLDGNIIWNYALGPTVFPNPIKLLPNGHFLINYNTNTSVDGTGSTLQEVDLAGTLIWQMTADDLNAALAAATCQGCNITVVGTHHDFVELPNGHLILLAGLVQNISGVAVQGDVVIDLDQNRKPAWIWNAFDHLDTNRRPFGFPDWTHSNAILYSADDGDLIVSMRHQSWLVKINYSNGSGDGSVLWKLGYQGDFALVGSSDTSDWFFNEHGISFASTNNAGQFSLAIFDNGNARVFPPSFACGAPGQPTCAWSTAQILQIDEVAKTATFAFHTLAPWYSVFGGNSELLANGNVEYCEAWKQELRGQFLGAIFEVTQENVPQTAWTMVVTGQNLYRGQRIPSLYPGVQW